MAQEIAARAAYSGLGTIEFLVEAENNNRFVFIEANARLQVEHTVTEEVLGVDLVAAQLRIAGGAALSDVGLVEAAKRKPQGFAIQLRVNAETMQADGGAHPTSGEILVYEPPSGPGVRVDGFGYAGYPINASFDSLIAKLVVHARDGGYAHALFCARRALGEFRVEGVATNLAFLEALMARPEVASNQVTTAFVDLHAERLARDAAAALPDRFFAERAAGFARRAHENLAPEGMRAIAAPMTGRVVAIEVEEGAVVKPGQAVAILEAMKMEHVVVAEFGGFVKRIDAREGEVLAVGDAILFVEPADGGREREPAGAKTV